MRFGRRRELFRGQRQVNLLVAVRRDGEPLRCVPLRPCHGVGVWVCGGWRRSSHHVSALLLRARSLRPLPRGTGSPPHVADPLVARRHPRRPSGSARPWVPESCFPRLSMSVSPIVVDIGVRRGRVPRRAWTSTRIGALGILRREEFESAIQGLRRRFGAWSSSATKGGPIHAVEGFDLVQQPIARHARASTYRAADVRRPQEVGCASQLQQ